MRRTETYEQLQQLETFDGVTKMDSGLIIERDESSVYVYGPGYTGLDSDAGFAFSDSLKEALQNYWRAEVENTEPLLKKVTKEATEIGQRVSEAYQAYQDANAELLNTQAELKQTVAETESRLKRAALELFDLTGDKNIGDLVLIKEKKLGLQYDVKDAKEWCSTQMPAALVTSLDTKVFEAYSKVTDLTFVEDLGKAPVAEISRKKLNDGV